MNCPVCGVQNEFPSLCKAHLGSDKIFDLLECSECRVRYIYPEPTYDDLLLLYSDGYYGSDWYKQQGYGMAFARSVLNRLPAGRFLDVGCGLGYFLDGVRQNSEWEVEGIELGETEARYAREVLGIEVHSNGFSELADSSCDYVQIKNVLEHVTDPAKLMHECRRVIKPMGTLHLWVPNGPVDSADLISFYQSEGRPGFSKSGHLFFFSQRSLRLLIENSGFQLVRARTYGIRRGLAMIGKWPRSANWKRHHEVRREGKYLKTEEISLPPKKLRPHIYYRYRMFRMNARMLPGMRSFGLDFELVLRPRV
jgi:SAM-dependent methyltransferase